MEEDQNTIERPELNTEQEITNFFAHQFSGTHEQWLPSQKNLLNEILKAVELVAKLKVLEGRLIELRELAFHFRDDKIISEMFENLIEIKDLEVKELNGSITKHFKIEEVKFLKFN